MGAEVNVGGSEGAVACSEDPGAMFSLATSIGGGEDEGIEDGAAKVMTESAFGVGIRPPANRNPSSGSLSGASILTSSAGGGGG